MASMTDTVVARGDGGPSLGGIRAFLASAAAVWRLYTRVQHGLPVSDADLAQTGFTREQVAFMARHCSRSTSC